MKGVFIYDINRCVSCLACVAGCKLINNFSIPWRMVLADNRGGNPGLPVHNLSIACNHCENPACLAACPAKAYSVNTETGAVILDEQRCLGCNYCFWCCPYDAPHYNSKLRTVQKCHFCNERILSGEEPACTSACPTGALKFSSANPVQETYGIIAETDLEPRVSFVKPRHMDSIDPFINEKEEPGSKSKVNPYGEWSLLIFTFLSSLLFGFSFSSLSGGLLPGAGLFVSLSVICLLIPLLHLGKPQRSWSAVRNLWQSPLSTEILLLVSFLLIANVAFLVQVRWVSAAAFITGLLLMVAIDNVYTTADRSIAFRFHPGQLFLTGLLFASLFGLEIKALIFIVAIKLLLNNRVRFFSMRSLRNMIIATAYNLLILLSVIMLLREGATVLTIVLFMFAELVNRAGYYLDFNPPGITGEYIKRRKYYEIKERDKQLEGTGLS